MQTDLQTNQVVTSISLSGNQAHIGGKSEDDQYVYIGTLEAPNAIIKVKVPEMAETLSASIPDVPLGNIIEQNGSLYVGTTNGRIYEYDALTLQQIRVLQLSTAPNVNVTGFIFYNGFIFACLGEVAGQAFNFFLVRIDPATLTEIDRVQIPVAQGVDVGFRVPLEVNGLIYCLVAGWPTPTRIVTVNPTNMTVLRFDDFPGSTGPDRLAYDGQYIYWNQDVRPSKLSRLDPTTYEFSAIEMPTAGETRASDVDIYQRTLYLNNIGLYPDPVSAGNISIVNLDTFTRTGVIDLGVGNEFPVQNLIVVGEQPPPPTGVLSIDTEPMKAEVFVDTSPWGTAPQSRTLDIGTYTVSFEDVLGYETPADQEGQVLQGQTTPVLGTYVETPLPPVLPPGKHFGWWETHPENQGYTPQEFFDAYFMTPPYPSFLEVLLTDYPKWSAWQSLWDWYDELLTLADAYPNIEVALMVGVPDLSVDQTWTDIEIFVNRFKGHSSVLGFGFMWEYAFPRTYATIIRADNLMKALGVRFISYRSGYEEFTPAIPATAMDIGITNFPGPDSMYAVLDRHTQAAAPYYIGQTAGYWIPYDFPSVISCPIDRVDRRFFGWRKCTLDLVVGIGASKDDVSRHALTICSGWSNTPFTGVSGKTTTRLWDNPVLRQWIWENPNYLGNFVLSTDSPPPPLPTGFLTVNTTPVKGPVIVNGTPRGTAPQTLTLDVGSYTLTFGQVEGYDPPPEQEVQVIENQTTDILAQYTEKPPPDFLYVLVPVGVSLTLIGVGILIWIGERG